MKPRALTHKFFRRNLIDDEASDQVVAEVRDLVQNPIQEELTGAGVSNSISSYVLNPWEATIIACLNAHLRGEGK